MGNELPNHESKIAPTAASVVAPTPAPTNVKNAEERLQNLLLRAQQEKEGRTKSRWNFIRNFVDGDFENSNLLLFAVGAVVVLGILYSAYKALTS